MYIRNSALALAGAFFLSACATVVTTTRQQIKVDSSPQGAKIYVAVRNEKNGGAIERKVEAGVTPNTVNISRKDGVILLEKEGYQPAEVPLVRSFNNWVWGDILLTSPLSTSIDTSTGASNEFDPGEYMVQLAPAQK